MQKTGRMRRVIARTFIKGIAVLLGILVISSALQFLIYVRGAEQFIELRGGQMSEAYPAPGRDEVVSKESIAYINELFFNRPFTPDLWPFDNESLWHKSRPEQE